MSKSRVALVCVNDRPGKDNMNAARTGRTNTVTFISEMKQLKNGQRTNYERSSSPSESVMAIIKFQDSRSAGHSGDGNEKEPEFLDRCSRPAA